MRTHRGRHRRTPRANGHSLSRLSNKEESEGKESDRNMIVIIIICELPSIHNVYITMYIPTISI